MVCMKDMDSMEDGKEVDNDDDSVDGEEGEEVSLSTAQTIPYDS